MIRAIAAAWVIGGGLYGIPVEGQI